MNKRSKAEKEEQIVLAHFLELVPKDLPAPEKIKNIEKYGLCEILSIISYLKPIVDKDQDYFFRSEAELKRGSKTASIERVQIFKEAYYTSLAKLKAYEIEAHKRIFTKEQVKTRDKSNKIKETSDDYERVIQLQNEYPDSDVKELFQKVAETKGKNEITVKSNYYFHLNNMRNNKKL